MTIGVVAICFNEETDLPGFLDCLVSWVDEIVLVDDGSNDRTKEIALSYGSKIKLIESPRQDGEYYSHQRNKGIDSATSDWLLHMDIDERVSSSLREEILQAIQKPEHDAFRFRRLNYFLHRPMKGGGWQDWNLIHLAKRELLRFGGMFHETIEIENMEQRNIGQLQNRMFHFNDDSFAERLSKSNTYLEEVASHLRESGKQVGYFGISIAVLKEFLKKYFFKLGFRDGTPGLISAIHAATSVFRAHAVIWEEQNSISRSRIEQEFRDSNSE